MMIMTQAGPVTHCLTLHQQERTQVGFNPAHTSFCAALSKSVFLLTTCAWWGMIRIGGLSSRGLIEVFGDG